MPAADAELEPFHAGWRLSPNKRSIRRKRMGWFICAIVTMEPSERRKLKKPRTDWRRSLDVRSKRAHAYLKLAANLQY